MSPSHSLRNNVIALFTLVSVSLSLILIPARASTDHTQEEKPKNLIFLVGDGMGPAHITAYRLFKDDPSTPEIEKTIFDELLVGMVNTSADYAAGQVTDSAASATAYATGHKTLNGFIAVDSNKQPLPTLLERAKHKGKTVGVVVTSQVTHATPAAFLSHIDSRRKQHQIAEQYYSNQHNGKPIADLILGGGTRYFSEQLLQRFTDSGYTVATDKKALHQASSLPVLGLFADKGLTPVIERKDNDLGLVLMTQKALALLSNDEQAQKNGFTLVIEASQIDWASHSNNTLTMLHEMDEFAKTLRLVKEFVENNTNTLMVATADHETGGLSLGAEIDGKARYFWNQQFYRSWDQSYAQYVHSDPQLEALKSTLKTSNIPLEKANVLDTISNLKNPASKAEQLNLFINEITTTGWSTHGHTAVDVQLMAFGLNAQLFHGYFDNMDIGKILSNQL